MLAVQGIRETYTLVPLHGCTKRPAQVIEIRSRPWTEIDRADLCRAAFDAVHLRAFRQWSLRVTRLNAWMSMLSAKIVNPCLLASSPIWTTRTSVLPTRTIGML